MPKPAPALFALNQIKHAWILLVSGLLFAATVFLDRSREQADPPWIIACYLLAFAIACLWGVANYIAHMRLNAKFRNVHDIRAYVEQLSMDEEDKLELQNYLEDFAEDLVSQGRSPAQAAKEAIAQFKVQEFLSLSKQSFLFEFYAHTYLIGWTIVLAGCFLLIGAAGAVLFPTSVLYVLTASTLLTYSIGFAGLFFIYKLLDVLLYKRLHAYFS